MHTRDADPLDPTISLAVVLNLKMSEVAAVRSALEGLPGVRVIVTKVGPPKTLWIKEGQGP